MRLAPSKFGAEPKKLAALVGLLVILGIVYWMNRTPSTPGGAAASSSPAPVALPAARPATSPLGPRTSSQIPLPPQRSSTRDANNIQDFRPTVKLPEGTDISRINPTLKRDLLAKLQNATIEVGSRSLFEFSQPPAPKAAPPAVKPIIPAPETAKVEAPPPPPVVPVKPALPPIPLKFYGYVNTNAAGKRRAFFLEGEDIFVAAEDEMIENRYKIVRIGVNSAVVEDTTNKNQQTLPLVEELAG